MTDLTDPFRIDDVAMVMFGRPVRSQNAYTFHNGVVDAQIIRVDRPVYWFVDTEQEEVLVSRNDDPWDDETRFAYVTHSSVDSGRVTNIPKRFFSDFNQFGSDEANRRHRVDDPYLLEENQLYYPVSPPTCFHEYFGAYLLPVDRVVELWSARFAQTYTDKDVRDYGIEIPEDSEADSGGEPA